QPVLAGTPREAPAKQNEQFKEQKPSQRPGRAGRAVDGTVVGEVDHNESSDGKAAEGEGDFARRKRDDESLGAAKKLTKSGAPAGAAAALGPDAGGARSGEKDSSPEDGEAEKRSEKH